MDERMNNFKGLSQNIIIMPQMVKWDDFFRVVILQNNCFSSASLEGGELSRRVSRCHESL